VDIIIQGNRSDIRISLLAIEIAKLLDKNSINGDFTDSTLSLFPNLRLKKPFSLKDIFNKKDRINIHVVPYTLVYKELYDTRK
jgi:hypothetical protein